MSYDLEWSDLPSPVPEAKAEWLTALGRGSGAAEALGRYRAALAEARSNAPCYLHLNISGMDVVRQAALELSLAYPAEHPDFRDFGFHKEGGQPFSEWAEETANNAVAAEFERAMEIARWAGSPGKRGIPLYKLSSNGPWYVTAGQAAEAVIALDAAGRAPTLADDHRALWEDFVRFLRGSRLTNGFRVD
jgi:hypothetical protein